MNENGGRPDWVDRRTILQSTAAAGGLGLLPASAGADRGSGTSSRGKSSTDDEILGDFEGGLDGWRTNGGNELKQITEDDVPAGVTNGSHALQIEVNGDAYPVIENKRRVRRADFTERPCLGLHVIALTKRTDSDLRLQFRLHHTASGGDQSNGSGSNGGRTPKSKDSNVEKSGWKSISQLRPQELQWDMSGLSTDIRETAKRLEIVWYIEGHEPDGGPRGRTNGEFDYNGFVVFDDIRLYESPPISETARQHDKKLELHRNHGMIVDRTFDERREDFERGRVVYADGTEISFSFEVLGEDKFAYTIDGETFKIGGG